MEKANASQPTWLQSLLSLQETHKPTHARLLARWRIVPQPQSNMSFGGLWRGCLFTDADKHQLQLMSFKLLSLPVRSVNESRVNVFRSWSVYFILCCGFHAQNQPSSPLVTQQHATNRNIVPNLQYKMDLKLHCRPAPYFEFSREISGSGTCVRRARAASHAIKRHSQQLTRSYERE